MNKDADHIGYVAQQVIEGNMREIIGQMKLSELICIVENQMGL